MQTLVFNTTEKKVWVYDGTAHVSNLIYKFEDVPTVKPLQDYYEVMQKLSSESAPSGYSSVPVARFPISNTNMIIEK
jgi:hypothetical protein